MDLNVLLSVSSFEKFGITNREFKFWNFKLVISSNWNSCCSSLCLVVIHLAIKFLEFKCLEIKTDLNLVTFTSVIKQGDFKLLSTAIKASKNLEGWDYLRWLSSILNNRPLALRGHVTNASFKQWVGILLMPKIDRAHKNYLTPEIWGETHLREIFYGTLTFQQSSMFCIGRHVGGYTLALQHGGQNYFLLVSC